MRSFILKNTVMIVCLITILNLVLAIALVKINICNKIYTIGVNRLTDSFTKGLNNTSLTPEQQTAQIVNFAKVLEAALLEFQAQGKVLLMEEAVLSGGVDITEQVVKRIKKGMTNLG